MNEALEVILSVQELDMKMMRLMKLKKERKQELDDICGLKKELQNRYDEKQNEVKEVKELVVSYEKQAEDLQERLTGLEKKQNNLKKMDEFNALSHEMAVVEKEYSQIEQLISKLVDEQMEHESMLSQIQEHLKETTEKYHEIERDICMRVKAINEEGNALQKEREELAKDADKEILSIYEKLLKKKLDRVVVPMEGRTCSGCHIVLTAHYENLVRRRERLVFCEHCSRILYWMEASEDLTSGEAASLVKRRRRRKRAAVA